MKHVVSSWVSGVLLLTAPLSVYAIDNGPTWFGFSYQLNTSGARTMGMGGTAVASVNDATATLTNPAALVRLSKNEFRLDTNYRHLEAVNEPGASNLGTGKSIQMGLQVEETSQPDPALMALATPLGDGKTVVALFYHEFLPYDRTVTVTDPISGGIAEKHKVMFDLDEFGFSVAHRFEEELSIGLSASLVTPNMFIRTLRDDTPSATFSGAEFSSYGSQGEQEPVWRLGLLYEPDDTVAMGINYTLTQDPQYIMTTANSPETVNSAPLNGCSNDIAGNWVCQSALPMPNILSIGFEFTPNDVWSFAVEAVQIDYGSSVDEFAAVYAYPDGDVQVVQTRSDFQAEEVTEYHAGMEYSTMFRKYPLALRAGYYFDPAHDIKYTGTDSTSKVIFTGGEDVHHLTAGFGILFKESLKVGMAVDAGDDDNFRAALSLAYQY